MKVWFFFNKAKELLPGIMWANEGNGRAEYLRGNYRTALSNFSKSSTAGRDVWIALNYIKLSDIDSARSHLNKFLQRGDVPFEGTLDKLHYYTAKSLIAHLLILEGQTAQGKTLMRQTIEKLDAELSDNFPPKFALLGACYGSLGMVKESVSQLKLGTGAWFDYYFLKQLPLFDPVRSDDVFQETLNQIRAKYIEMQERVLAKEYLDDVLKR